MAHVNALINKIVEQMCLSDRHGYDIHYANQIPTTLTSVHQEIVIWMIDNLSGGWGWYFEEEVQSSNDCEIILKHVVFTFEHDEEAVLFSLAHRLN